MAEKLAVDVVVIKLLKNRYMKYLNCILFGIFYMTSLVGQETIDTYKMSANSREIEADFLSSYYQQDGNNAAVTGGIGTEQLQDVANVFILNVPIDSVNSVSLYGGADYYTSASTDAIDNNVSSASVEDVRGFGTLTYSRLNINRSEAYSIKAGFSAEYDYTSISGGLSYTKEWNEGNTEFTVVTQAFIDTWQTYFPRELRNQVSVPTKNRQSYNGQLLFSQILSKRLQLGISAEAIYMTGLLSTPFHRVYFSDATRPDIERLPNTRLKIPVGIRLNYFPFDNLVLRSYYRYYYDDFGINAHTFELEAPIKIAQVFTLSPFYRFHTQTASQYFAPYQTHVSTQEFYSSDYDLSALQSHKIGIGFQYNPLYGVVRTKPFFKSRRVFMVKKLGVRLATYSRSTGLTAFIGSVNIGFSLK